jgi:hypothetical protein
MDAPDMKARKNISRPTIPPMTSPSYPLNPLVYLPSLLQPSIRQMLTLQNKSHPWDLMLRNEDGFNKFSAQARVLLT